MKSLLNRVQKILDINYQNEETLRKTKRIAEIELKITELSNQSTIFQLFG